MDVFYDRFMDFCGRKGVKPAQVARDLGISQSTISMWKSQGTTPNALTISRLAKYFETIPERLLDLEERDWAAEDINTPIGDPDQTPESIPLNISISDTSFGISLFREIERSSGLNLEGVHKIMDLIDDFRQSPKYRKNGDDGSAKKV